MSPITARPPRTALEVFQMMPEGTLAEIIENQFFMSPAPNPFHQRVSGNLFTSINVFVLKNKLGEVFSAPVDVYIKEVNVVQPDILFIAKKNDLVVDEKGLHGVPDLIIEVLSPGNQQYDLGKKKELYEKTGVKEYWVVDPKTKIAVGFLLKKESYECIGEFKSQVRLSVLKKNFKF